MSISATRLSDHPIIHANMDNRMGSNINGPSLIKCPKWVENPLGANYLYFADHRGTYLRMAFADDVKGPWRMYEPGVLDLSQSSFPTEPGMEGEFSYAHIASPDVHVMANTQEIRLYYHGLCATGDQMTAVAVSADGLSFVARPGFISPAYLRAFRYGQEWYGIAMPGTLVRSTDGLQPFAVYGDILPNTTRHSAVLVDKDTLHVVWSQVGEAPERLYYGRVELSVGVTSRFVSDPHEILHPGEQWEGVDAPLIPSAYGAANSFVNELRDPCLFADGGQFYLLYCGGGEAGIGLARLHV